MSYGRVLNSYKKMLIMLEENKFKMKKLVEDKEVSFKDKKYHLKKGTVVLDCDDELLARVMYMNDIINYEFIKRNITTEEITKIIKEVENIEQ